MADKEIKYINKIFSKHYDDVLVGVATKENWYVVFIQGEEDFHIGFEDGMWTVVFLNKYTNTNGDQYISCTGTSLEKILEAVIKSFSETLGHEMYLCKGFLK